MRPPLVAGQFYESEFDQLERQIKNCFSHKQGPGALPLKTRKGSLLGAIVPHAGYTFSGPCAAWAYKKLAESKFKGNFIILGPCHMGSTEIIISTEDFETPFGIIKTNKNICAELLKNSFIKEDNDLHRLEHSIEVQLPFLQYVNKDHIKDIKIIPILVGCYDKRLAEAITNLNEEFTVIASSDFIHYGREYNYTPFVFNKKESMYALDIQIIEFIKKLDTNGFLDFTKNKTVCGRLPIATMIDLAKWYKAKPKLLHYYTSGDISDDYNNSVGYASINFEQ